MLERKLLAAALQDRAAYDLLAASPGETGAFDPVLQSVLAAAGTFYERDPEAGAVDIDLLAKSLASSEANPKRGREAEETARSIFAETVSTENVRALLRAHARDRKGMALASAIAARKPEDEVRAALDAFVSSLDDTEPETEDVPDWTAALRSRLDRSGRMAVSPKALNEHLGGGLLPGHNVTVFGRPESGKTGLAITMACGFARRGYKVLYLGNEDPLQDLMVRVITNLAGATVDEIATDPDRYERLALEKGASRMVMRSTAPGSMREIEGLVKQHKPQVLFIDQLRNITNGKADNYTQLLDRNAQAVRALGKRYGMVTVSVTQAGDSATGKAILGLGDVDSSNTGIPGAADVLVGVGVTEALESAGQRMISLPKNKIGVHAQFPVSFDTFRSKMR